MTVIVMNVNGTEVSGQVETSELSSDQIDELDAHDLDYVDFSCYLDVKKYPGDDYYVTPYKLRLNNFEGPIRTIKLSDDDIDIGELMLSIVDITGPFYWEEVV